MKMERLREFGMPVEMIEAWREGMGECLLPLQERVVVNHGLFEGGNLLIQAPTSAGKTFVGELAAVHAALGGKRVVYLVPLRALAEEKYGEFLGKYGEYGIDVIVSSRDRREFDGRLERGDYSLAVVVYEKFAQLLVRRPEQLREVALVVADELEVLSDVGRGAGVELLLTQLFRAGVRVIGLSAVIGEGRALAEWMGAECVCYEQRPVELRFGVLYEGRFRYRTYNGSEEGEEALVDSGGGDAGEALVQNVRALAEAGETCLVFVKSRMESRRGAARVAESLDLCAAVETIGVLEELEATHCRDDLLVTLREGVAFHNADLSVEERRAVEDGFRRGDVRVIVATSTLGMGLNLPARNTFISEDRWRFDDRFGMPWKAPISRSEYENMGGRAGRYGSGQPFGRSILMAATAFDRESLWRRYVEGEREAIVPQLAAAPLENAVLSLVASRGARTRAALVEAFEATLSGAWVWGRRFTQEEFEGNVRAALHRAIDAGVVQDTPDGRLFPTPLGHAAASKGITVPTVVVLEDWVRQSESRAWTALDPIVAAALSPDGRLPAIGLTAEEYEGGDYVGELRRVTRDGADEARVALNRIRNGSVRPFFEEVRGVKVALMVRAWIDHRPIWEIEEEYRTSAGQIQSAADQIGWLLDATAAIAKSAGANSGFVERLATLAFRVQRGLREEAVPLGRLKVPGLSRTTIAALVEHQLYTPEAVAGAARGVLERWLARDDAAKLRQWAKRQLRRLEGERSKGCETSSAPENETILIVDERNPGAIVLYGETVSVQDKQFRLMLLLAERAGECVSYETIYESLWGDQTIVEQNQVHVQKAELLKRIRNTLSSDVQLFKTVPKRGFILLLRPDQVVVHRAAEVSVA